MWQFRRDISFSSSTRSTCSIMVETWIHIPHHCRALSCRRGTSLTLVAESWNLMYWHNKTSILGVEAHTQTGFARQWFWTHVSQSAEWTCQRHKNLFAYSLSLFCFACNSHSPQNKPIPSLTVSKDSLVPNFQGSESSPSAVWNSTPVLPLWHQELSMCDSRQPVRGLQSNSFK